MGDVRPLTLALSPKRGEGTLPLPPKRAGVRVGEANVMSVIDFHETQ